MVDYRFVCGTYLLCILIPVFTTDNAEATNKIKNNEISIKIPSVLQSIFLILN